ncbi:hypothetical protein pb186bvf_006058 [Paramecium bursaria]
MDNISYKDYAILISDLNKAKLIVQSVERDCTIMRQTCFHCAKEHHIFEEEHNAVFQQYTEMDFIEEILQTECYQYYQLCQWAEKQVTNMPNEIKQILNQDPNLDQSIQNQLKSIRPIGQIGETYLDIHNNDYEGSIEWIHNLQKLSQEVFFDKQNQVLKFITFQADLTGDFYYQQWTRLRSQLYSKFLACFRKNYPYFKDVINFGYTIDYQIYEFNYIYSDMPLDYSMINQGRILQQVLIQFFMNTTGQLNIEEVEKVKKQLLVIDQRFHKQQIDIFYLLGYIFTKLRKFSKDIDVEDILQLLLVQRQKCTEILIQSRNHDCKQLQARFIQKLLKEQNGQNETEDFLLKLKKQDNFFFIQVALDSIECYVDEFLIIDLIQTFYKDWERIYQFQRLMEKIIQHGNFVKKKDKYPRKLEAYQFLTELYPNRFDMAEYIYNMMTNRQFAFENLDKLQKQQIPPKWQRKILIQLVNFCDTIDDMQIIKELVELTYKDLNLSRLPNDNDKDGNISS